MELIRIVVAVASAGILVACGAGSTSSTSAPATPTGTSAAPDSVSASASPTAVACSQLPLEAAHLPTYVHYVALDLGTTNDPAQYMPEITTAIDTISATVPACAAAAQDEVAELSTALRYLRLHYLVGSDEVSVAGDKQLLSAVREKGTAAWTALGYPTLPWESLPTPTG